jgi:hypothetical protein
LRRADDLVVTDAGEGQILDCPSAACVQDPTGLVWAASGGRVLPPEASLGWATPLGVFREERHERLRIAMVQSVGCSTKLVDHGRSMAQSDENGRVPPVGLLQVEAASRRRRLRVWKPTIGDATEFPGRCDQPKPSLREALTRSAGR